ncbi:MAG: hypothetical protein R3C02_01725 [Planctomycetaceae bacterium]
MGWRGAVFLLAGVILIVRTAFGVAFNILVESDLAGEGCLPVMVATGIVAAVSSVFALRMGDDGTGLGAG